MTMHKTGKKVPEWSRDRTHNRGGLEAACSKTVKGELPDLPSMCQRGSIEETREAGVCRYAPPLRTN